MLLCTEIKHFRCNCQRKISLFYKKMHSKWKEVFAQSDVLPLAAVGDFGALHCQPSTNVDRSTALDLTTSAPIAANGCYSQWFLVVR